MNGLDTGAIIALYPAGTTDTSTAIPLATGKIMQSGNFSSIARLDKALDIQVPAAAWAFVRERAYHINPVTVQLQSAKAQNPGRSFSAREIDAVKRRIEELPFARYRKDADLLVVRGRLSDSIRLRCNGALFATVKNILEDSEAFAGRLEEYARCKFLATLNSTVTSVSVDVRLLPFKNGAVDTLAMFSSLFEAHEGDSVTLKIRNTGTKDVYVNILDLQPDGKINAILPCRSQGIYPQDLKILAGQEYIFPKKYFIRISPPFGTEVFKIFASESEINVENIATSRGSGTKSIMSVMERLINNSYSLSRGGEVSSMGNADATTSEFVFLIKP